MNQVPASAIALRVRIGTCGLRLRQKARGQGYWMRRRRGVEDAQALWRQGQDRQARCGFPREDARCGQCRRGGHPDDGLPRLKYQNVF